MEGSLIFMKKKVLLCALIGATLLASGCGEKEETMTCTRSATIAEGIKMDLKYKVTYKGDYVTLVESEETVTSSNEDYLDEYKTKVESLYSPYKDVEFYNYDVKVDGDKLTSKTSINYEKIDTKKMIEIDSANSSLIKDGKVKVDDIKSVYAALGTTCE